ncbi:hypothetical protein HHI36_019299 [Cryptolaemus montrouzieri]|uniref:Caspase family p20 domain-containing protein n=1 Tax=Cryptolaemus montrouzieri TaxID=559131 RepID=A0ABD2P316_9CUCU
MNELEVKPSTELIPDEYYVPLDEKRCVHIFAAEESLLGECKFLDTLEVERKYNKNVHSMNSSEEILETLKKVSEDENERSMLLMLFWGYSRKDGEFLLEDDSTLTFQQIWSRFMSSDCKSFRDKPKVFIFNVIKSRKANMKDGSRYVEDKSPYEVPNGADLLIIFKYNKALKESIIFIEEFTDVLNKYGKREDLCSLVTVINTEKCLRPVIISTMLKKLYLIHSRSRGNYLQMETYQNSTQIELEKIQTILVEVSRGNEKSPSLIKKMKNRFSSFRNRNTSVNESIENKNLKEKIELTNTKTLHNSATSVNKSSKEISARLSDNMIGPRASADKARRLSSARVPVKKISTGEKQPWRP